MNTRFGRLTIALSAIASLSATFALADTMTAVSATGFNRDMIVEIGGNATAVNATFDGGWGGIGDGSALNTAFFQQGAVSDSTRGLVAGVRTSSSDANTTFSLQSFNSNNALYLDHGDHTSGTLTFTTPRAYRQLAVFSSSGGGSPTVGYTIHYADSTTQTGSFTSKDWFGGGDTVAVNEKGRVYYDSAWTLDPNTESLVSLGASIYQASITGFDSSKTIASIDFAATSDNTAKTAIFAISGTSVPEPGTLLMSLCCAIGLTAYAWRRRK